MDAKGLAKSKRAHSLHQSRKHNPHPTSKAPLGSATGGSGKKPTGKPERQRPSQGSRALPSNWDRYEEEYDLGFEDLPQPSTSQASDVVAPKSKGADYAHLIAEAKAQSQSNYVSDSFTLLNDAVDDVGVGLGPLLSVKGQHMLSWISDDNFLLDDKRTSSQEASFLSLNLLFLAEQLEKANLAERLFIDPDLLPPELCTEIQSKSMRSPDEGKATSHTKETVNASNTLAFKRISENNKNVQQPSEYVSSDSGKSCCISVPTSSSGDFLDHRMDEFLQLNETSSSNLEKPTSDRRVDSLIGKPGFEAAAAEAELDILLDSLSETNVFDSSNVTEQSRHALYMPQGSSVQSLPVPLQHVKEGCDTKNLESMSSDRDGGIDDLLKETSNLMNKGVLSLPEVEAAYNDASSASHPDSKTKILDDFSSWLDSI